MKLTVGVCPVLLVSTKRDIPKRVYQFRTDADKSLALWFSTGTISRHLCNEH